MKVTISGWSTSSGPSTHVTQATISGLLDGATYMFPVTASNPIGPAAPSAAGESAPSLRSADGGGGGGGALRAGAGDGRADRGWRAARAYRADRQPGLAVAAGDHLGHLGGALRAAGQHGRPSVRYVPMVEIDASLVARLVAAQFPQWAGLEITPAQPNGWDNRTFRLGPDLSVRLPSAEPYAAQVRKEHRWLPVLAPHLPLPIPVPVAMGVPAEGYAWNWSVYRWLDGVPASTRPAGDLTELAVTLARFLRSLERLDARDGPPPGRHNFFRGGPLTTYDAETRDAIAAVHGHVPAERATTVWESALASAWRGAPVWVHGDVAAGNLLLRDGRLHAVIDFGSSAVGDPACDLTIAWTLLSGPSREAFRAVLPLDAGTWARARGWALWKALIVFAGNLGSDPAVAAEARRVIDEVLADHDRRT
jgi:aminoglycoside phosphotransferase (APT) family kinase protein